MVFKFEPDLTSILDCNLLTIRLSFYSYLSGLLSIKMNYEISKSWNYIRTHELYIGIIGSKQKGPAFSPLKWKNLPNPPIESFSVYHTYLKIQIKMSLVGESIITKADRHMEQIRLFHSISTGNAVLYLNKGKLKSFSSNYVNFSVNFKCFIFALYSSTP